MSRPRTPIDKRFDHVDNKLARIELRQDRMERAIGAMASRLVQAQTGFGQKDYEGIEKILRGEKLDEN